MQEQREAGRKIILFFLSLWIVSFGQPVRLGFLGAAAAALGFALFFHSLPAFFSRKSRFAAGALWFCTVQLVQLSWMTAIEFQGYYILFVYALMASAIAAQFGLLTAIIPREGKISFVSILALSSFWTLMEWVRLLVMCGFSWNPVGLALTHFIPSLQLASVFGVLGLSFYVIFTNLLALNVRGAKSAGYWIAAAAFPYIFGIGQMEFFSKGFEKKQLDVALVQTDLLPSEKIPLSHRTREFITPLQQWESIFKYIQEKKRDSWDLIVLPEAAVPMPSDACIHPYEEAKKILTGALGSGCERYFPPLQFPFAKARPAWHVSNLFLCQTLANFYESDVLAGLDHIDRATKENFNSAFFFSPGNRPFQRYDKQILLPLGEYLPWEFLRPLTKSYGIAEFFTHGKEKKIFGSKVPFTPSICYEETFSEIIRNRGADLFVNVTNDNYYPDSTLHAQHLYHSRIRAVENGVPLLRACNSGVTAVVDSFGRILAKIESGEGVLNYSLKVLHFPTLFSFWGDGGIVSLSLIFFIYALRMKINF